MNGHVHDQLVSAEPPSLGLHNIEFSCPAARSHVLHVLRTILALKDNVQGVNCNDLLHFQHFHHQFERYMVLPISFQVLSSHIASPFEPFLVEESIPL